MIEIAEDGEATISRRLLVDPSLEQRDLFGESFAIAARNVEQEAPATRLSMHRNER